MAEDKNIPTLEERFSTLEERYNTLEEENEVLAGRIAELDGSGMQTKEDAEEKKQLPEGTFKDGKKEYKFKVYDFVLPGFGKITAADALKNKKVTARLVELGASGIIEEC